MKIKNNYGDGLEQKDYHGKPVLSRYDYDLYDEGKNIKQPIVRVKRFQTSVNGERWKVMSEDEVMFIIEGNKLSKKEKEYLRTPEGFNFLIYQYKNNINTVSKIKIQLKNHLKKI